MTLEPLVTAAELADTVAILNGAQTAPQPLEFQTLAQLCAEVDAQGPRKWLIRGLWPAGAYGVHAAEMKAQKTWNALDLAVSVATGTPWLDTVPVDQTGPVLVFAGEGGKPSIVRRIRAICANRDLHAEHLDIVICARAPHLSDDHHLGLVAVHLNATKPLLVILDPLYLAAGNAKGADLYAMAPVLERIQHLCEPVGASLFVVTHYNRKEGNSPLARVTGAGPSEWGRVIIGGRVVSRHTDNTTLATSATIELDAVGGEIPDQALRIRREIRAENPDDLDSPLHYNVEALPPEETQPEDSLDLPPAARKLLEAIDALTPPVTASELVDWIAGKYGHGLRRETVSKNLNQLEKDGILTCCNPESLPGTPRIWERTPAVTSETSHVTSRPREDSVTAVISPIGDHAARSHVTVTATANRNWLDDLAATVDLDQPAGTLDEPTP